MTFLDLESSIPQNNIGIKLSQVEADLDKRQNLCKATCKDGSKCLNKGKYASFCRHHRFCKRNNKKVINA